MTEEKDYILHEPLDATKYRFSVNVVIEKTLGVVNPDDPSLPSNSSKLNLETEGDSRSCVDFFGITYFQCLIVTISSPNM